MAYYLFNHAGDDAVQRLRSGTWPVGADEPRRGELAPADLVLVYAAGARAFVGCAVLGSGADDSGVALDEVELWDPPVPMDEVLAEIPASEKAKGEFPFGVMRITEVEHQAALAVAASRETPAEDAT